MRSWRTVAAVAVVTIGAFVAGATSRLVEAVDDPASFAALAILAIALVGAVALGARSRRLSTAYW